MISGLSLLLFITIIISLGNQKRLTKIGMGGKLRPRVYMRPVKLFNLNFDLNAEFFSNFKRSDSVEETELEPPQSSLNDGDTLLTAAGSQCLDCLAATGVFQGNSVQQQISD